MCDAAGRCHVGLHAPRTQLLGGSALARSTRAVDMYISRCRCCTIATIATAPIVPAADGHILFPRIPEYPVPL